MTMLRALCIAFTLAACGGGALEQTAPDAAPVAQDAQIDGGVAPDAGEDARPSWCVAPPSAWWAFCDAGR